MKANSIDKRMLVVACVIASPVAFIGCGRGKTTPPGPESSFVDKPTVLVNSIHFEQCSPPPFHRNWCDTMNRVLIPVVLGLVSVLLVSGCQQKLDTLEESIEAEAEEFEKSVEAEAGKFEKSVESKAAQFETSLETVAGKLEEEAGKVEERNDDD